jgi:hypothetical protein
MARPIYASCHNVYAYKVLWIYLKFWDSSVTKTKVSLSCFALCLVPCSVCAADRGVVIGTKHCKQIKMVEATVLSVFKYGTHNCKYFSNVQRPQDAMYTSVNQPIESVTGYFQNIWFNIFNIDMLSIGVCIHIFSLKCASFLSQTYIFVN